MSNMSYCRFQNTLRDLRDCHENMDLDDDADDIEVRARARLIALCATIAAEYGDQDEDD